jgi:uncharacterized protein (TIGR02001 family)
MKFKFKALKLLKSALFTLLGVVLACTFNPDHAKAQEISTSVDIYSTYIFRGVAFSGPSIQPTVEFSSGGFAIGAWGSQGYDGFQEMDLYAGYEFDFGLSIGVTDYYYPGSDYFDGDSHAFEINTGLDISNFSLSANIILNEAPAAGSAGSDLYFEAGLSLGAADLFVGAGDGWHSGDGEFALVNVGISTSKEIVITDTFTIPLSGAVILNPDSEQFYIVVGVSF